jgi:hypothetical protein
LLSGTAEPFWPHFVLLSVSIIAAFAVGFGILLESPKYSAAVHRVATWLVLGGIAVESACTVFLFVFDERISDAQQSKIAALETRLAILYEGAEQRQLKPEQVSSIVSDLVGKIPPLNILRTRDPEASQFAVDIFLNLAQGGLPIGIIDEDSETKYFGFSDAPLFLYCTDREAGPLVVKAFMKAGINIAWGDKPSQFAPSQPANTIYVSLKAPLFFGMPAWALEQPKK